MPDGGSCGRIQASRLSLVSVVPLKVRPIRPRESTAVGGAARSGSGTRSGCTGVVDPPEAPHAGRCSAWRCGSGTGSRRRTAGRRRRRPRSRGCSDSPGPMDWESSRCEGDSLVGGSLFRPVSRVVERRVGDRVEPPAVTAAVQVEHVELLGADVDDPELGRVGRGSRAASAWPGRRRCRSCRRGASPRGRPAAGCGTARSGS